MVALRERIVEQLERIPESDLPEVMDFLEFLSWKAHHARPGQVADFVALEDDPIVGLISGPADLAAQSETILQDEITERSGWTWKAEQSQ